MLWLLIVLTRTVREVSSRDQDKTVPDSKVLKSLLTVLHALHNNDAHSPKNKQCAGDVMYNALGYEIKRFNSTIAGAGKGIIVIKGTVPANSLVALYPGMIIIIELLLTGSHMLSFVLVLGIYLCIRPLSLLLFIFGCMFCLANTPVWKIEHYIDSVVPENIHVLVPWVKLDRNIHTCQWKRRHETLRPNEQIVVLYINGQKN